MRWIKYLDATSIPGLNEADSFTPFLDGFCSGKTDWYGLSFLPLLYHRPCLAFLLPLPLLCPTLPIFYLLIFVRCIVRKFFFIEFGKVYIFDHLWCVPLYSFHLGLCPSTPLWLTCSCFSPPCPRIPGTQAPPGRLPWRALWHFLPGRLFVLINRAVFLNISVCSFAYSYIIIIIIFMCAACFFFPLFFFFLSLFLPSVLYYFCPFKPWLSFWGFAVPFWTRGIIY